MDYGLVWRLGAFFGAVLALLGVGFLSLLGRLSQLRERQQFAQEFREKFITYCNSQGQDSAAYNWLILNSTRMQSEMGPHGVYDGFRPPATNYMIRNYQIITNMIPELRRYIDQNRQSLGSLFSSQIDSYANAIDEALLRYIGVVYEQQKQTQQNIGNPALWLRLGVEQILSAPLLILVWFGLASNYVVQNIQGNIFFKAIAMMATVIGLISGAITIALGWQQTVKLVQETLF